MMVDNRGPSTIPSECFRTYRLRSCRGIGSVAPAHACPVGLDNEDEPQS